ncbi:MAG: YceG family protein [Ruminococcus sp.]|jgi:hypothetical protein|nr:YceG family protein [Ruminococcus sp.]
MIFKPYSENEKKPESGVIYLKTTAEGFHADTMKLKDERLRENNFAIDYLPVYFAALIGIPDTSKDAEALSVYRNMLYNLRDSLSNSDKFIIYMENVRRPPTPDELAPFSEIPAEKLNTRAEIITLFCEKSLMRDPVREGKLNSALTDVLSEISDTEVKPVAMTLLSWLNRCTKSDGYARACGEIPLLLYYGMITEAETRFLRLVSRIGFDVLYICEDKQVLHALDNAPNLQFFELPSSGSVTPYPDKLLKVKIATQSYIAERQLDTYLYGGDTFFRDFQFEKMHALTLKTTFDEIDLMWHEQAKFRSGFEVKGDRAYVPNIFAKISGVRDADMENYWDEVRFKLSPYTKIIRHSPTFRRGMDTFTLRAYSAYYSGERILADSLKRSPLNKYTFLSDAIQDMIFEKMQEAADSGFLKLDFNELIPQIMYVGLNLDKEILRILQKFDYTKDIPKFIVIDTIEDTFTKTECIQLILYNLFGFDILVFTPTGYRNLETFVSDTAFEEYTLNEFVYNAKVPRLVPPLRIPDTEKYLKKKRRRR